MPLKAAYYLRFGSRRVPWMVIKEGHDGSEYVIFPMDRTGFKISKHPFADPHMRDNRGFKKRLDLAALRSVNWDEAIMEWQPWWESLFYWPSHRADLIAIPGPPGKTWLEGIEELFRGSETDVLELFKVALGYGTIYKVGYRDRKSFFETRLGRGCIIVDPRNRRFGFYAGELYPDRPLLGIGWQEGGFSLPLPRSLNEWKGALDTRLELAIEQYFEAAQEEVEAAMLEVLPDLQAFVDDFRVVRWRPEPGSKVIDGLPS